MRSAAGMSSDRLRHPSACHLAMLAKFLEQTNTIALPNCYPHRNMFPEIVFQLPLPFWPRSELLFSGVTPSRSLSLSQAQCDK